MAAKLTLSPSRAWTASWICFMLGSKEEPYPGRVPIMSWCDYDNKNWYICYVLGFEVIFQFCLFWLLLPFGKIFLQLNFFLLGMLTGPKNIVTRIVFLFLFFNKIQDGRQIICYSWAWTASPFGSKEATYPGHMLIRFWCDSDILFLQGLHKKLVTVLYFSIITLSTLVAKSMWGGWRLVKIVLSRFYIAGFSSVWKGVPGNNYDLTHLRTMIIDVLMLMLTFISLIDHWCPNLILTIMLL